MKSTALAALRLSSILKLDGAIHRFPEGLKTDGYTHTLHRFPGKFVPQVADELINIVLENNPSQKFPILDPFCGCGTTNIQAAVQDIESIGTDFDPLAVFIAKAKTTILNEEEISTLIKYWSRPFPAHASGPWVPPIENLLHWFSKDCVGELAYLKEQCRKIKSEKVRLFSLCVFSAIIRRVSLADDQTQKTYVSGTLKKNPPLPRDLFPIMMKRAVNGIEQYRIDCRRAPSIRRDDARHLSTVGKIGGVVTSPPYLDSIDYIYNQMLEYFWLYPELGLTSTAEIKGLRKEPMGFVRYSLDDENNLLKKPCPKTSVLVSQLAARIAESSQKEAEHVIGYFSDYLSHLKAIKKKIVPGGIYTIVVGESTIRGVVVPTPDILKNLFEELDFSYIGGCAYEIRRHYMKFPRRDNSGKIKIDYVLCFRL